MIVTGLGDISQATADVSSSLQQDLTPSDWILIVLGGYALWSVIFTTRRGYEHVSGRVSSMRSKGKKRRDLEQELREL